jgi:hypothetical protein
MTMSLATRELHGSGVYGELAISNPLGICADLVGGEWRDKTVKLSPHTMPTVAVLLALGACVGPQSSAPSRLIAAVPGRDGRGVNPLTA